MASIETLAMVKIANDWNGKTPWIFQLFNQIIPSIGFLIVVQDQSRKWKTKFAIRTAWAHTKDLYFLSSIDSNIALHSYSARINSFFFVLYKRTTFSTSQRLFLFLFLPFRKWTMFSVKLHCMRCSMFQRIRERPKEKSK